VTINRSITSILISILTLSIASTMFYSSYIGRDIAERYAPLIDAAKEIKVASTTAHLRLEKVINGDVNVNIEQTWAHIDQAEWYAQVMLDGGVDSSGFHEGVPFLAIKDPELREQITHAINSIHLFRDSALERWAAKEHSGIGSAIDQRFELLFSELITAADHVELSLHRVTSEKLQHFSFIQNLLISIILAFGVLITLLLHAYNKKREHDIEELHDREENLSITLNSIGDAVIVTNAAGAVTHLNPIAESLTGWKLEHALGKPLTQVFNIVHAHTMQPAENPVEKVLSSGGIVGLANHTMLISKQGINYQIADSGAPIRANNGDISGVVLVFRNVTEEYELNESLESGQIFIQALLETLPDLVWVKNKEGVYLSCNAKFSRLFGAPEHEIVGKTDYDFVDKELADFFRENDLIALNAGKATINEETVTFADDGHSELLETIKTPMFDAHGQLIGILGVARDITQRYHMTAALEQFKTIFDESPLGVALIDSHTGQVYKVNEKFAAIAGRTMAEMIEIDWMSITHPDDIQEDLDQMALLNAGKISGFNMQKRYQQPNGRYIWIDMTIAPITVEDKSQPRHLCMIQDISARKQLEDEALSTLQHLKLYREQTPLAAIEWTTNFQVLDWNEAAEKMFGYSLDEVKGRNFVDIMLPESAIVDVEEIWRNLISQTGGTISFNENKTKDGSIILCEWHNTPLLDESGIVIGAASLVIDVTLEHAAKQALEQQEQEQREILNMLSDGVISINEDGTILSYNQAAERLFGFSINEALGQNVSILMPEPDKEQHDSYLKSFILSNRDLALSDSREVMGQHKNNSTFPLRLSLTELPHSPGEKRRFIGSCQDLSQIKVQQSQLQRAQKMDALGKIVGGIAHDYNNMLGVILGYTDLMEIKYSHIDGLQKYIDNISQAGERGRNLTKRMLNFSKQESTHSQSVTLHHLLDKQKELLEKSVTARIQLNYQLCDTDWKIWIDPSELEDCLLNLTLNAQHAMPYGGTLSFTSKTAHLSHVEASALGLAANDYLSLSITDTGSGIEPDILSKIFDPFFSTKGSNGTGLGLSQVYGFMERAGGVVRAYSQQNIGTEFTLYFPRYLGNEEPTDDSSQIYSIRQGDGETILVVDDEPALRELAQEILSMAGYHVLTASDGDNAIEILSVNAVDVVLSDVIMPNMDGYQLAKLIQDNYPTIKIQLASGFSDNRHLSSLDTHLHKMLLHKPYSSAELLNRIATLLHGENDD